MPMSVKTLKVKRPKRLPAGTELTVAFAPGQKTVVYVVEDLGDIGVGGKRLLRVSSTKDPSAADAVVFDLPSDLSQFAL